MSSPTNVVNIVKINWHCVQTFAKYWQVKACSQTTVKCWQVQGPQQQIGGCSNYHTHWQLSPHHKSHVRIITASWTCRNLLFSKWAVDKHLLLPHSEQTSCHFILNIPKWSSSSWKRNNANHFKVLEHNGKKSPCCLDTLAFLAHLKIGSKIFPSAFQMNFHRAGAVNLWLNHFGRRAIAELNRLWVIIVLPVACAAPERIKELQNPFPPRLDEIVYPHTDLGLHTTKLTLGGSIVFFWI